MFFRVSSTLLFFALFNLENFVANRRTAMISSQIKVEASKRRTSQRIRRNATLPNALVNVTTESQLRKHCKKILKAEGVNALRIASSQKTAILCNQAAHFFNQFILQFLQPDHVFLQLDQTPFALSQLLLR